MEVSTRPKSTSADISSVARDHLLAKGFSDSSQAQFRLALADFLDERLPLVDAITRRQIEEQVVADLSGLGCLEPLLADPEISEVMVNGPNSIWVERRGQLRKEEIEISASQAQSIIQRIVGPLGLRIDRASPIVDARLSDGSRVNAVLPPLAVDGPYLTIRRFTRSGLDLSSFCKPHVALMLEAAVKARKNLLVIGATSSGKTSLLNALAARINRGQRIITIEDAAELALRSEHVVRLEARPANAEGAGMVSIRDLLKNALRMRPDRIIVGEVRGAEALDMLQAMNTGHEGSMSTCHANSPIDALRRLETMGMQADIDLPLSALRYQIASAIDLVVGVRRCPDGARTVYEVSEVEMLADLPSTRPIYRLDRSHTDQGLVDVTESDVARS